MIKEKTVAVVIPAYNEASQIGGVLEGMPDFVDRIIVVDDASTDNTREIVELYRTKLGQRPLNRKASLISGYGNREEKIREMLDAERDKFPGAVIQQNHPDDRLILISMDRNCGVGAAIARGYLWARDMGIDTTAVMAGDGQMDPADLEAVCMPVIEGIADYSKGNRIRHRGAKVLIPRSRFLGNSILSILTKIASGYWKVSDSQTGFTAISLDALHSIELHKIYPRYGMPNDMLVKLNMAYCTVTEIDINPVYGIGETSKLIPRKVILPISWLLLRSFFKRLWNKYLFRDFHPLFLLYHFSFLLFLIAIPYTIKILRLVILGIHANPVTVLAFVFLFISGLQSLLFAMWMDMLDNERLYK